MAALVAHDAPALYAVILTTGATGWTVSRLLLAVERRVVSWRA